MSIEQRPGVERRSKIPAQRSIPVVPQPVQTQTVTAARLLAVLRIAIGLVFLWAFLDKLFGFGYATTGASAWIRGGSPTRGYLGHANTGPLASMFRSWAGTWWADWLFMIGLGAIGLALLAGIGLRVTAAAGSLLLLLMWASEWPLARHTATGQLTSSANPLIDYHIIFALVLIALAATGAGATWGFGRWWANRVIVDRNPWLR